MSSTKKKTQSVSMSIINELIWLFLCTLLQSHFLNIIRVFTIPMTQSMKNWFVDKFSNFSSKNVALGNIELALVTWSMKEDLS